MLKRITAGMLTDALDLGPREVVALVGGGGKTTLMYRLLAELRARRVRAAGATTTKIMPPAEEDGAYPLETMDNGVPKDAGRGKRGLSPVLISGFLENGKVKGVPPEACDRYFASGMADVLVVDGDPYRNINCLLGQGDHIPLVMKAGDIFHDGLTGS